MKEWKLSIFNILDKRIKFYSQNTNLLPPKSKSSFRHLEQGIQEFHRKYVLVPADKAANNVVVVCRLHYINTLKQELNGTKAYEETSIDEKSVVYSYSNEIPNKFAVYVKERQDRLPTVYWLPKLYIRPYKDRFIYFEGMVNQIYPSELQLNKANTSDTEAPFLDLHLSISNGFVSSKIYDKRDDFDFDIVNFPFLDGDVPRRPSYGVYISAHKICSSI